MVSGDEDSEISNFENFELSETSSSVHSCHNLSLNHLPKMESDCVDNSPPSIKVDGGSSNQDNIMQMLTTISTKMMDTIQDLQNQLATNDLKYTAELQKLSQENETFRQNVLAEVHRANSDSNNGSTSSQVSTQPLVSSTAVPPNTTTSGLSASVSTSSSSQDFQEQMMTMMNTTFTKLTTVMSEAKSTESKADWPKFAGDMRKFKPWYLAIVAQLSIAPWKEFYDSTNNTVIKTTGNTALKISSST
jgi:hypothetical protein